MEVLNLFTASPQHYYISFCFEAIIRYQFEMSPSSDGKTTLTTETLTICTEAAYNDIIPANVSYS